MPIWFRVNGGFWNGNADADPAAGIGGYPLSTCAGASMVPFALCGASNLQANFGQTNFSYSVPAGFVAGWPAVAGGWTTFNPSTIQSFGSADGALSNGNLKFTMTTYSGGCQAFAADAQSIGSYYFEYKITGLSGSANNTGMGVLASGANYSNFVSSAAFSGSNPAGGARLNSSTPSSANSNIYVNNVEQNASFDTAAVNNVYSVAVTLEPSPLLVAMNICGNYQSYSTQNDLGIANPYSQFCLLWTLQIPNTATWSWTTYSTNAINLGITSGGVSLQLFDANNASIGSGSWAFTAGGGDAISTFGIGTKGIGTGGSSGVTVTIGQVVTFAISCNTSSHTITVSMNGVALTGNFAWSSSNAINNPTGYTLALLPSDTGALSTGDFLFYVGTAAPVGMPVVDFSVSATAANYQQNAAGSGGPFTSAIVPQLAGYPCPPVSLACGASTLSSIIAMWTPSTLGGTPTSYTLIYRQLGATIWNTVSGITQTSVTLTGLVANTQYEWQVASVNSIGTSAFTNSTVCQTLMFPATIVGVQARAVTGLLTVHDVNFLQPIVGVATSGQADAGETFILLPALGMLSFAVTETVPLVTPRLSDTRHDEWVMMRPGDESSLPSAQLWQQLRDSLGGFDDHGRSLPNSKLSQWRNTGIYPGQNMFVVPNNADLRGGLMAARASFIGIVNNILARNPVAIERQTYLSTLYRSAPINEDMIWVQGNVSDTWEPPPVTEWDIQVYSLIERNRLVARPDFQAALTHGDTIRVLLSGIGNSTPRWSIWDFAAPGIGWDDNGWDILTLGWDASSETFNIQYIDQQFTLRRSYEHVVSSPADRDALVSPVVTLQPGDRVLVNNEALGFWAVWRWNGVPSSGIATDGFVLSRVQYYRTDDFIDLVDWYAAGYSAASPPVVSYPTVQQRNLTEGPNPNNLFVRVNDNGAGAWIWTVWSAAAQQWTTVAIQNGTIALSTELCNVSRELSFGPTGELFGWDQQSWDGPGFTSTWDAPEATPVSVLSDAIANRDGSWEIRILADALRYGGLLLDSEVNEIFFSMLNFIHTQEDQVTWAFKTSFMSLLGYNVPLQQTPFQAQDTTPSLISYIDEVKPYRVKLREFSTQYNPDLDVANGHATDYDKPIYYDPALKAYRPLDPNDAADLAILVGSQPWSDWYQAQSDSRVRSFDMALLFDRVTSEVGFGWGDALWDNDSWDNKETAANYNFVHTTVVHTLTADSPTITVDDVRWLRFVWTDDELGPVSNSSPLRVVINGNSYLVGAVTTDTVNVSTTRGGISGTLTTIGGNFQASDGVADTLVEAILMQPSAARRIEDYYVATDGMPPKNLTQLLDLDVHGTQVSLTTSAAALSGNVLTFASTASVLTNVPVFGPNIVKGTTVIDISPNVVTLSQTIAGPIPLGAVISFGLPTVIDGYVLPAFTSANAFDVTAFDTIGFDIHSGILDVDYDGGDNPLDPNAIQVSVNPATQYRPYGLGLRDPYYAANHPQERLPLTGDDGLQMTVTTMPQAGGPPQIIWLFDVSGDDGTTATLFFSELPHASDAVLVYRDGVRATFGSDYTVDYFGRTVTVDIVGVDLVQIHSFGFGGTSTINANPTTMLDNRYFFAFSSNPLTLQQSTDVNHARVIVNGTALTSSQYSVTGNQVTLATPPATGSDVAIVIYDGGVSTATEIQFETLTYNINQQWTLNPVDSITEPGHGGTIVEVNGIRLRPPTTFYGQFTSNQLWMYLPLSPEVGDTYSVYVDGVLYTTAIPFCTTTSPSSLYPFKLVIPTGQTPPTNVAGQFVFFGGLLVALDPTFSSNNVAIVIIPQGTHPDYQITNGVLTIHPTLSAGDLITVFSFSNASSMGWQTVTYDYVYTPYIISIPYDRDYALVAFDGLAKAPYVDYDIMNFDVGWDTLPLDSAPYDIIFEAAELVLSPSAISAGPYSWVVASLCTQPPAHGLLQWMSYTTTPSFNRMPAALKADGTQVTAVPNHSQAMQPLPQYDTRYGSIRLSPYLAGTLAQTLAPTDTQMVVNLLLRSIAPKLEPALPLPTVFGNEPAVVWINGERIEYFGYARNGQTVTLSGLRRGTQGTSIQEQRVIGTGPGTGGSATYPVNAVGTVEVMVNGQPVAINGFSTHVSGGTTYVTLTAPVGQEVVIAITIGYTYSVGAVVYNGEEPFVLPMPRESQAIVVAPPPPSTPPISDTRPIGGVGASGSAGGLSIFTHRSISQAITGVTLSGSAGRPTITGSQLLQRAITGVSLSGSAGKPTIGNTTVARAITGVLSTTGIGKLTVSNIGGTLSRAITGVSSSGASGTPTISSTSGGGGSGIPMQNHSLYYISGTANAASINPANVASGQAALPGTGFDVVIVEATNDGVGGDASHFWTSQQVASMRKTSNTKVFGYFDIQAETQRCYYSSSTAAGTGWTGPTLKGSNIVGGTPNNWGEYGIQIWTSAYYQITQLWIQRLVAAGFDGIYFDVSDTWTDTQYVQPNAPAVPAGSPGAPPAGFAAKSASAAAWWETQFFMDMRAYGRTLNPNFLVAENAGEGMLDAGANTYLLTHASDAAYIGPRLIQACDFFYREEVLYQSYNGGYKGTVGIVTDPSDDYGNLSQIVAAGKPVGLCEYVGAGTNANAIGGGTVNCPVLGTVTVQAGSTAAIHYIRQVCAAWNFGFYVSVADFTVSAGPTLSVVDTDGILIP